MPVKDKVEKEAYCDVCGKDWSQTCAICGGVFCDDHNILVEFKRKNSILRRRICKKCLDKLPSLAEVINGHEPNHWQGQEAAFPELPKFIVMQTDEY